MRWNPTESYGILVNPRESQRILGNPSESYGILANPRDQRSPQHPFPEMSPLKSFIRPCLLREAPCKCKMLERTERNTFLGISPLNALLRSLQFERYLSNALPVLRQLRFINHSFFYAFFGVFFGSVLGGFWGSPGVPFGSHFASKNRSKNRLKNRWNFGGFQGPQWLPKWSQNRCKSRFSRILKTLISHGRYCKNEGMGPLRGIRKVPNQSVENLLHFLRVFRIILGALQASKISKTVYKI